MPVLRYFTVAGAGLLALLFMVNAWLPAPVITERDAAALDKTTIRINGEKPVAERVTIDTSVPAVTPPVASISVKEPSVQEPSVAEPPVAQADVKDESKRDALARMEDAKAAPPLVTPPVPAKKVAARKHPKRAVVTAQPSGLFDLW